LAETEGILPALEPSHAIAYLKPLCKKLSKKSLVIVCLSGRGDKDVEIIAQLKKKVSYYGKKNREVMV
jgi:tryptophan synthase beta chain